MAGESEEGGADITKFGSSFGLSSCGSGFPATFNLSEIPGCGSYEQQRGAHVIASKLFDSQIRSERFEHRQNEEHLKTIAKHERIKAEQRAADIRSRKKLQQVLEENQRRAFANAARRSEQQKACREMLREHERVWAEYYAKVHNERPAHAPQSSKSKAPRKRVSSSGARLRCSSASGSSPTVGSSANPESRGGYVNEEVYQNMTRSHLIRNGTVERWKSFVSDNERRTDAHWQKLLGPSGRSYMETMLGRDARFSIYASRSRQKDEQDETIVAEGSSEDAVGVLGTDSATASTSSPGWTGTWGKKLQRCVSAGDERQLQNDESWKKVEAHVYGAKERKETLKADRGLKAAGMVASWAKRVATAKARKERETSDDALVRKHVEKQAKLEAQHGKLAEDAHEKAALQADATQTAHSRSAGLLEATVRCHKEVREKKDQQTVEFCERVIAERQHNPEVLGYTEKAAQKILKKQELIEDVRNKAKQEIEEKEKRSCESLRKQRQPYFERQRSQRNARSAGPSSNSRRCSRKSNMSGLVEEEEQSCAPSERGSVETPPETTGVRISTEKLDGDPAVVAVTHLNSISPAAASWRSGDALPSDNEVEELAKCADAAAITAKKMSKAQTGEDTESEEDILKDMEESSVKWVHAMRRKMGSMPLRPL
eukprot:TRINITY_DN44013_c0_g1_i1.p1 TRINITY_DN44013_c0_g1~~TRINITY_DN44013_c0_g1_i1.p1  ORF type:complete len:774 (+),score=137.77 TRINITY_DN44013_c0_g1_i1:348-2324(+)